MSNIINIILAVPIAIIYNIIIHQLGNIFNNDLMYNDRVQRNLLLSFGGGILAIFSALYLFCNTCKYKNTTMRYGFYLGAILLLLHSLFYNWSSMQSDTKFIIMVVFLSIMIFYSYRYSSDHNDHNDKIKNKKQIIKDIIKSKVNIDRVNKKNVPLYDNDRPLYDKNRSFYDKNDEETIIDLYE
jgi:uncharacterized membrane protein